MQSQHEKHNFEYYLALAAKKIEEEISNSIRNRYFIIGFITFS
jgi:hypothetical protein